MGTMFSFFAKAATSSAISGYATNRVLSSFAISRPARLSATGIASLAGLAYYIKVWVQDFYFDWSYNDDRDLTGRTAVVTGGTVDGLGYGAAELLLQQGAKVLITVRTKEKGEAALKKLNCDSRASYVLCDFLSESSVRKCVAEIKEKTDGGIDFLVLNAGTSGGGKKAKKSGENQNDTIEAEERMKNFEAAKVWMTNHVGPWIFAKELMPSLVQAAKRNPSEHPRVVWVSSGAHKKAVIDWKDPFHPSRARVGVAVSPYGQSKLANVMHAREYQKRVRAMVQEGTENESIDVKCFSVTPGLVWTNIIPTIKILYPLFWLIMRTPTTGAQVIKMACLDNELKGGEYLSNCCVKESEGVDGCSKDEELWKRLWELTAKQVEEKEYDKLTETDKKTQ